MQPRYTYKDFQTQFASDADCLRFIYEQRYPQGATCKACGTQGHFYPVQGRRSYACQCGSQIYPTQGTIYHKSPTSLKTWFFAMFLMTASKNGVSARELERQLGVTYKCAWRMAHQIRQLLKEEIPTLRGTLEADETYYGGRRKMEEKHDNKTPIIGVLERGGNIVVKAVPRATTKTVLRNIVSNADPIGSQIMTDEWPGYKGLSKMGWKHYTINHSKFEWARGAVYTNGIEGFWSQLKRSINGTFHFVSRKHLQKYVNEFSFRYNRRKSETAMFHHVAARAAAQHAAAV
jgi:transposase